MLLRVVVHPRDEFDRWVAAQRRPPARTPPSRAGSAALPLARCVNCHRVRGTPANGVFGPDLTHLMSRRTLAARAWRATPRRSCARGWTTRSDQARGLMPALKLSSDELDQ